MDQIKTGQFIAQIRSEKGLTQRELAERIHMSDKTISKWETGKGMPDISIIEELCSELEISVNELLSGERLSEDSYSKKAEENIMGLMKENKTLKKTGVAQVVVGVLLLVGSFLFCFVTAGGISGFAWLIDTPSMIMIALISVGAVLASRKRTYREILLVLQKVSIPAGVLFALGSFIVMIHYISEPALVGPNLAVCVLSVIYALIEYIVVTILLCSKE